MAIDIETGAAMDKTTRDASAVPPEFLLKQIEHEINSGFAFVAAARRAYQLSEPVAAGGALDKATAKHEHIAKELRDSPSMQVRSIIHQLSELREAIDWLRETHFERSASN